MPERVTHSLVKALRCVPTFAEFDDRTLVQVVGASANLFWPAETPVFERGSESQALYIVLAGRIRIVDTGDGGEDVEIAQLGEGEFFGELSLLAHTTHTKSALTLEDSELMVIPKASFEELLECSPELAAGLRRKVEERLAAGAPAESRLA